MGLPVVGMVGGGQLSRMTHQAAIALGLSLRVLADADHADDGEPHRAADRHGSRLVRADRAALPARSGRLTGG
jgi:phosphoribosylaminoimidazole carboxylase (NCAIR synthetase)